MISPLIFNIALHGIEEAAGAAYQWNPYRETWAAAPGTPVLVRYADDFVALCESPEQAEQVKARLTPWLASRGLTFNEDKTRVVHLDDGVDFLGFNIRRYGGKKLLIKPSAGAVERIRRRLAEEVRALRGANASAVIAKLNPIVRGWTAYYKGVVSTETFQKLDRHVWRLTYKWALYRHNRRSKHRIINRYFGRFHPTRQDRWVFGDRDSGAFLVRFAWTKIVRHDLVKGSASPDDPALADYWAKRRRRNNDAPPLGHLRLLLLRKQKGRCPVCNGLLLHADHPPRSPEEWEQWAAAIRKAITVNAIAVADSGPDLKEQRLVHEYCRRRKTFRGKPVKQPARKTFGLA
ncbi:MAG: group II intron maturase-specific domain-containing protein [Candidatus Methylomirabilaceae bacterium]